MQTKLKPVLERPLHDGTQRIFMFDNNYGASVVKHEFSYGGHAGKWELAVLKWDGTNPRSDRENWDICYDTPITNDVIGWLDDQDVDDLLDQIAALPADSSTSDE